VYLVKCEKGVLALCSEKESHNYINLGKEKNLKVVTKKITTNLGRANQIGYNIFKLQYPCSTKNDLLNFRNTVIKEWMQRCESIKNSNKSIVWSKVAAKHNVQVNTPEEFSQSIMDKVEYACP
jgi:hypothetical protein